jgi:hypothetical protein
MFKGFNFNSNNEEEKCNCPDCRGVSNTDIEHMEIDVNVEDPGELIAEYFELIKMSESEEELFEMLMDFFNEVCYNSHQQFLLDQLNMTINALHFHQYGEDEE